MTRTVPHINEIVSFAVLLLMVVALIAGEADATMQQAARDEAAWAEARQQQDTGARLRLSMGSRTGEAPLMISVLVDAAPGGARTHD
jgi:hypothetical protein